MLPISQAKIHCTATTDGNELRREMADWKVSQNTLARISRVEIHDRNHREETRRKA